MVLDPITGIGLVASSLQLAMLSFSVLEHLIKYCRELLDAPSECKALRYELCCLSSILFHVEETYSKQDMPEPLKREYEALKHPVEKMHSITEKQMQGSRLKWPFRKKETTDYLDTIKTSMKRIDLFLNSDNRYVVDTTNADGVRRAIGRIETTTRGIERNTEETRGFNQGSIM